MTTSLIRDRWRSSADALKKIHKRIQQEGVVDGNDSPFAPRGGDRADFRGLDLSRLKLKGVTFDKSDLSFTDISSSRIEGCTFTDVMFEKTDFSDFVDHGNGFENVVFLNCKFNNAAIGYRGSRYTNCRFERSSFRRAIFIRAEFSFCEFVNCNLKGVDMFASSFENCRFVGKLEDVWFRGGYELESDTKEFGVAKKNQMKNVSFEEAELIGLTFSNDCDLSTIKLPKVGNYHLFDNWKQRLEKVKSRISEWPPELRKEAETFIRVYSVHAKSQDWELMNEDELKDDFGVAVGERIMRALNEV